MTPAFSLVLIIAVAISVFLLFEILYNLHRQKKMERLQSAFDKAATESGLRIGKQQLLGDRIIGLDETINKLLFVKLTGSKEDRYLVDLEKVSDLSIDKSYMPFWNGSEKMGVLVQAIALRFTWKNEAKPLLLPFYRNTTDQFFDMSEREKQAKEWQMLLSARLNEDSTAITEYKKSFEERLLVA
jgi:hypothetical protein